MNILITGFAGFIGSNLTEKLLENGHSVIGTDNFDDFYPRKIKENNIASFIKNPKFKMFETDIRNYEALENMFQNQKTDLVIHLAAKAGVRTSFEHPAEYKSVNFNGTKNILDLMTKYNVPKIIFASSSSVYGNKKEELLSENMVNLTPISPYAETKSDCEKLIKEYSATGAINAVCLRFFTVYGKRQRPDLAISKFVNAIIKDEEITIYGDGSSSRDYTYIDDTVDGIIKAIDFDTPFEIINIGGGNNILLKDMVNAIEHEIGKKAKIKYLPMQKGDITKTHSDITKAKKLLNWQPKVNFNEGLHRFAEFIRSEQK